AAPGLDREHGAAFLDRGRERARVALEELDHLGHAHVAVGIVSPVAVAGEPGLPVGAEEAERVPSLAPPTLGDAAALEDHVIDADVLETAAHGEPRLSAADHDRLHAPHGSQPAFTPTSTGTPWARTW